MLSSPRNLNIHNMSMFTTPHHLYSTNYDNLYTTTPGRYRQPQFQSPPGPMYHHHHQHINTSPLKVIQLVEVPPPVKSDHVTSPPTTSASSSCSSSSESDTEDEPCTSYCSSEDDDEHHPAGHGHPVQYPGVKYEETRQSAVQLPNMDNEMSRRMVRIEKWREEYAKAVGAKFAPSPLRSKRKGSENCSTMDDNSDNIDEDDNHSRSSKRSRQPSTRSVHSCSACDASFASRQSLRRHGRGIRTNEACRAAVEYGFE